MKILAVFSVVVFASVSAFSQKMTDLEKLVDTERAFARAAAEKSTKEAFLEFLADDSIVFEPTAVNGIEVWKKRPPSVGLLSWEPVWADINADGDLGYTTGPWQFWPKGKDGEPVAFGEYVTIWKKQKDGNFKAILDIGISHGKPEGSTPKLKFPVTDAKQDNKAGLTPGEDGTNKSLGDDVRIYRDGEFVLGGSDALARVNAEKRMAEEGECKSEGGMQYCFGRIESSFDSDKPIKGNFLRILRYRGGKWQVVLDLFTAISE